jgi:hypothetical protein
MKNALSVKDIQNELSCSANHARAIVLNELPHFDISTRGSFRPTWRVKRSDFEKWREQRNKEPGLERIEQFAQKFTR